MSRQRTTRRTGSELPGGARASVLIVEDDDLVGPAFARLVKPIAPVILVATLAAARRVLLTAQVQLALIDVGLPDGSGFDLVTDIRATRSKGAAIVIVTGQHDPELTGRASGAGVTYLAKGDAPGPDGWLHEHLRDLAMRAMGEVDLQEARSAAASWLSDDIGATRRQREILELLALGAEASDLGEHLGISRETVKDHLNGLRHRLGVAPGESLSAAVLEALSERVIRAPGWGLVTPPFRGGK